MNDIEKPDLKNGISLASFPESGKLLGVADGEEVLLARRGAEFSAIGAYCTHYHGPLAEGLVIDDTVRCPWHHACYSLRTGEALRAPALNPVDCFDVEQRAGKVFVLGKRTPSRTRPPAAGPPSVIIVGAGAAGNVAAETLRREGYGGRVTLIGAE